MKRLFLVITIIFIAATMVSAGDITPSADKTASAVVDADNGAFNGILVVTDGTNAVTLDIYDTNVAVASGRKLVPQITIPTGASNRLFVLSFDPPLPYKIGCYVVVTCVGTVTYKTYTE